MLGTIFYLPKLIWWAIPFTGAKPPWYKEPRELYTNYYIAKVMYRPHVSKKALKKEWYKIFGKEGEHIVGHIYKDFTSKTYLDWMENGFFEEMHTFEGHMEGLFFEPETSWRTGLYVRSLMISGEAMERVDESSSFFIIERHDWTEHVYQGVRRYKQKALFQSTKNTVIEMLMARGGMDSWECECGKPLVETLKFNGHCSNCGTYIVDDDDLEEEIDKLQKAA